MWSLFWIQNLHYALEVFVGFMMITAAWIYFDGWMVERLKKTLIRSAGFFVLALWSFADSVPGGFTPISGAATATVVDWVGFFGFVLLFFSLLIDPVPVKPGKKDIPFLTKFWLKNFVLAPLLFYGKTSEFFSRAWVVMLPTILVIGAILSQPKSWMFVFASLTTILLYIHYNSGIQREWKYFYWGFLLIAVSLGLAVLESVFSGTSNVFFMGLLGKYHFVWILQHLIKFVGAAMWIGWAWGFIRFRIFPQIFSSSMVITFTIFICTAILYTGFLLTRTQAGIVENIGTNIRVVDFALNKVKESSILAARISASNPKVIEALRRGDREALLKNLNTLMFENGTDFMIAVNAGGEVIARAEDEQAYGDSLAEDQTVWRALEGKAVVTISVEKGVTIPVVEIKASSPVVDTTETGLPKIIGVVVTGVLLDTAFVDGFKQVTGLDVVIFADDISSATTLTVPGGNYRLTGNRESNTAITDTVIKKGQIYTGNTTLFNQPFVAAYVPLKDIEETTVGMLFTAVSQASILALISDVMQRTFMISVLLMVAFILPLRWLAAFISRNQEV
ncbi:MAG: cache domain-containing protein [bacterium]|nr:cache domain-containing protein [bacterium]